MTTMTITEFLLARIAEVRDCDGTGEYRACSDLSGWAESMVDATRRLLDLHDGEHHCTTYTAAEDNNPCRTLITLADVYASHPDYNPDWQS